MRRELVRDRPHGDRTGIGLFAVLALFAVGRFTPGVWTWGFSHLAYLPAWMFGLWILLAGVLSWPRAPQGIADLFLGRFSAFLLESKLAFPVVALVSGLLFAALGRHTHFLGDGTWLAVNVASGQQFHFFDFVDYRLHVLAYRAFGGNVPADTLYRAGSVGAGVLASILHLALVRRLLWQPWRRILAYLLLFSMPPTVLYFGYVESYSLLFVAMTAFLLAGILVCERRFPLWGASAFYGLGLLLHLSALFSLPALLFLGWIAPLGRLELASRMAGSESASRVEGSKSHAMTEPDTIRRFLGKRALYTLGPPIVCVLLALVLYVASGYDLARFRREFLESEQGRRIFLPLAGERGILSIQHFKDLSNLVFLTAPACVVVCLFQVRSIATSFRSLWRGPSETRGGEIRAGEIRAGEIRGGEIRAGEIRAGEIRAGEIRADRLAVIFLVVQIGAVSAVRLLVEAKLGGAKDWDLVAGQSAALPLLAALLVGRAPNAGVDARPRSLPGLLLGVSFLTTAPWIVLQNLEDRSIARLIEVTVDSPLDTRTYDLEEVGRYYRDRNDYGRAIRLYEECVRRAPAHARLRAQLGTLYYLQQDQARAEAHYREALRLDPDTELALQMLGEIELARGNPPAALALARRLVEVMPDPLASWDLLARSATAAESWADAARALAQVGRLNPDVKTDRELGLALLRSGDPVAAASSLRRSVQAGAGDVQTRLALAWALLESASRISAPTGAHSDLDEAEALLRGILRENPADPDATELLARVIAMRD